MKAGPSTWFWLAKETRCELNRYDALVKEAKSLDEGLRFAQYVLNSGLADLLDQHRSEGQLPCDGRVIRKQAESLRKAVWRRYETRDTKPHVETSDLESLRADVAALKRQLGIETPPLRLIKGGADESV